MNIIKYVTLSNSNDLFGLMGAGQKEIVDPIVSAMKVESTITNKLIFRKQRRYCYFKFRDLTYGTKWASLIILVITILMSCSTKSVRKPVDSGPAPIDTVKADVLVDCAITQGPVMRIEGENNASTTSDLPGDKTRSWLKSLHPHMIRLWIQLQYVYNKGAINYNYKISGTNAHLEDVLAYYSACTDSLLVVLSAYKGSATWPVPQDAAFTQFLTNTLGYYKVKYPKISYVTVGNEPNHEDEPMSSYYPAYQRFYRAVNRVNDSLDLQDNPIKICNGALTSNISGMLAYADGFLKAYAEDTDPSKHLDAFCFHSYGESDRPAQLAGAGERIDSAMAANHLPKIPILVTEFGLVGGHGLPKGMTLDQTITMEPAGQLTKAFYLYEGGISAMFNWCIHHKTIEYKSEIADLDEATLYPYGNAINFARAVSDRQTRISASSDHINTNGLGVHVLASMGNGKGVAVLVWNYNWTNVDNSSGDFIVRVKNIPLSEFGSGKFASQIFLIDARHNNYSYDRSQNTLKASVQGIENYAGSMDFNVHLEANAVALILLTPQ